MLESQSQFSSPATRRAAYWADVVIEKEPVSIERVEPDPCETNGISGGIEEVRMT